MPTGLAAGIIATATGSGTSFGATWDYLKVALGAPLLDGTFPYDELPTCSDDIQNGNELGVDCGGPCPVCASCDDGVQNGSETAVDCGGSCPACPSCTDGLQNGDEDGVDCGGSCMECPSCDDGEQNGDETDTDCGGSCSPCASCSDGLQNGTETGVDCGGSCLDCPSCFDGLQNGDESAVDCGGSCQPCASCSDGLQNGNETGIDCGGACATCSDLCDDQVTYDARSMTHTQTMNVCSRALRPHAQILVQRAEPSMTAAAGASTAAPARGAPATASMPARALQPLSPTPADCNHLRIGSNHPRVWVETSVAMSHDLCRRLAQLTRPVATKSRAQLRKERTYLANARRFSGIGHVAHDVHVMSARGTQNRALRRPTMRHHRWRPEQ